MDLINFNQYNIDKTANYGGSDKKKIVNYKMLVVFFFSKK